MNNEFLQAIFGEDAPWAHVTDFSYDPNKIPKDQHLTAWAGNYFSRYRMGTDTNQYFTISTFYCDDEQKARRRKALFRKTHAIVLDDVKEKLNLADVERLPKPSWVLETSPGSEQWGYILQTPCENRLQVENLLDGLVANGLAPDGKDPGMKGVTRYVRLPDGINNKESKLVDGKPFKCALTLWNPEQKVTMEQLAQPFNVNLNAVRREASITGAANVPDHPLLKSCLTVKEVRSDGRFDITCPWVDQHTDGDDSGTAIFTNEDGSMGFKCHHGHCQDKTGRDLMVWLEQQQPGFSEEYTKWQLIRSLKNNETKEDVSFLEPPEEEDALDISQLIGEIRRYNPSSSEAREQASKVLRAVDSLNPMDRLQYHKEICDVMHWTKTELNQIISGLRNEWYSKHTEDKGFFQEVMFVRSLNRFYDWKKRIYYTAESFQNSFADEDEEARKGALQLGMVQKVDKLDYLPNGPRVFEEDGVTYGNMYVPSGDKGQPGAVTKWMDHFEKIGWGQYKNHILDWMAYTVQHPENKINHCLLLGGGEGIGKDFLLYPLVRAMGRNANVINGTDLTGQFNEYLMGTKYLHINETELGDHKEATMISSRLKPLAAAPPETLQINDKGVSRVSIRNIVNCSMTTNNLLPFKTEGVSRRFFAVWSHIKIRDSNYELKPEWREYWRDRWEWMKENYKACVYHLETRDVSQFNPYEAPPMTEFLQDIIQRSKPVAEQTIDALMENCYGYFGKPLVSLEQLVQSIRAAEVQHPEWLHVKASHFTAPRLGSILTKIGAERHVALDDNDNRIRIWSLRDHEYFKTMSGRDLYRWYNRELKVV